MKPMLNRIFTNEKIKAKVQNTHNAINHIFEGLTLEEVLVVGAKWNKSKIKMIKDSGQLDKIIEFFYEWDYEGSNESLTEKFPALYNMVEICGYAKWRAKYMQRMKKIGYDLSRPNRTVAELEEMVLYAGDYGSVTYAFKCFLIANYTTKEVNSYKGIQPQTNPVSQTVGYLFGKSENQYRHTVRCNQLANEVGISPTAINTTLWVMWE